MLVRVESQLSQYEGYRYSQQLQYVTRPLEGVGCTPSVTPGSLHAPFPLGL